MKNQFQKVRFDETLMIVSECQQIQDTPMNCGSINHQLSVSPPHGNEKTLGCIKYEFDPEKLKRHR